MDNSINVTFNLSEENNPILKSRYTFSGEFFHRFNSGDLIHVGALKSLLDDKSVDELTTLIHDFDNSLYQVTSIIWVKGKNRLNQYVELIVH